MTKERCENARGTQCRVYADRPAAQAAGALLHCRVLQIQAMGSVRSFCFHRLVLLEQKYNLHVMMNADKEFLAQKSAPHRDFYNVRKVQLTTCHPGRFSHNCVCSEHPSLSNRKAGSAPPPRHHGVR